MGKDCGADGWSQFVAIGILLVFVLLDLVAAYELAKGWKENERKRALQSKARRNAMTYASKIQHPYYATALALFLCVARNLTIAAAVFETWRVDRSSTIRVLVVTAINCQLFVWVCSCFVLVTRLQLCFGDTTHSVPRKHIQYFYICIALQLLFSTATSLLFGFGGGGERMTFVVRLLTTLSILWLFVQLSVLCKANVSRLLALVVATSRHRMSQTRTPTTTQTRESALDTAIGNGAQYNFDDEDKDKDDGMEAMPTRPQLRNLSDYTISAFKETEKPLLRVATKLSVLLVASICCALFTMIGVGISVGGTSPNSWCITVPMQFASLFLGIGINGLALCVYLSFVSSKNEYKLLCSKCDYWCGKMAALYVTKVVQSGN